MISQGVSARAECRFLSRCRPQLPQLSDPLQSLQSLLLSIKERLRNSTGTLPSLSSILHDAFQKRDIAPRRALAKKNRSPEFCAAADHAGYFLWVLEADQSCSRPQRLIETIFLC